MYLLEADTLVNNKYTRIMANHN